MGAVTCVAVAAIGGFALARREGGSARRPVPSADEGSGPAELELEYPTDGLESVEKPVDVLARVVHRERGARRRRYAKLAHQGLRAMMPGPDADADSTENLPDVVRVRAVERERDERSAIRRRKRSVDH